MTPTSRCSKYTGRPAIRFLHGLGKIRQLRRRGGCGRVVAGQHVDRRETEGFGHEETSPELTGRLAGLELDQEPAADPRRQRKLILAHLQRLSPASDHRSKRRRRPRGSLVNRVFIALHGSARVRSRIFHSNHSKVKEMYPSGNIRQMRAAFRTKSTRTGTLGQKSAQGKTPL